MPKEKSRVVGTRFWKDRWIRSCDPLERYLFMYLITNDQTSLCGIYQSTTDEMAHDTGLDYRQIPLMMEKFEAAGKAALFEEEWVIVMNSIKHHNLNNMHIRRGIEKELEALPEYVKVWATDHGYKGLMDESCMSLNNNNSNSNSNLTKDSALTAPRPLGPLKNTVANAIQQSFLAIQGVETWGNIARERKNCNDLAKKIESLAAEAELAMPMAREVVNVFYEAWKGAKTSYWKETPFTPSGLVRRWTDVMTLIKRGVMQNDVEWVK